MKTKAKTKTRAAAPRKPKTLTRESILAEMAPLLGKVEQIMKKRPSTSYSQSVNWAHPSGSLYDVGATFRVLHQQLDGLIVGDDMDPSRPGADEALFEHFSLKPGAPLEWAKPGSCIAWIADIPVRVVWGGFCCRMMTGFYALDGRRMFLAADGFSDEPVYSIDPEERSRERYLRRRLAAALERRDYQNKPQMTLRPLSEEGIAAVAAFRADPANAWWLEQVALGPVNPVMVPANLGIIQTKLFG